jgi:hypothetical protein
MSLQIIFAEVCKWEHLQFRLSNILSILAGHSNIMAVTVLMNIEI